MCVFFLIAIKIVVVKKPPNFVFNVMERERILREVFLNDEKSVVAHAAPKIVYDYLKRHFPKAGFTLQEVREFEQRHALGSQLLRNAKEGTEKGAPTLSYGLNEIWQLDLADTHDKHYVLARIDVTSRQGDLVWVSDKSARKVLQAFRKLIFRNAGIFPHRLQTDRGTEFFNKHFSTYTEQNGVNHFASYGDKKAAVVERFNATWQRFYYKGLKYRKYQRNKQKLLDLVAHNYNRRPHSALPRGLALIDVDIDTANTLVSARLDKTYRKENVKKLPRGIKKGDAVRITRARSAFFKQYRGNFSNEVFIVSKVYRQAGAPETVLYKLRDLLGEEIKGVFYKPQLQKVLLPAKPVITCVVRKVKNKGYLVELLNYPQDYRVWLSKRNIRHGYTLGENVRLTS